MRSAGDGSGAYHCAHVLVRERAAEPRSGRAAACLPHGRALAGHPYAGPVHNEKMAVATPRTAAGVIFSDGQSHVLLVHPTYKDYWDIPGGYVLPGESPRAAAVREVREELGLSVVIGKLLAVDWAPSAAEGDKLLFLFAGPKLPRDVVFAFPDGEIDEARYVHLAELSQYTIGRLARRLRSTLAGNGGYLEHGVPPVSTPDFPELRGLDDRG